MNSYHSIEADADNPFFFTVYADTRTAEMASWGWSSEEQLEFLRTQFKFQQRSYQVQYPNLESRIVLSGNTPAGRMLLARNETETVLVDISLLANFHNLGIGAALLQELQGEINPGGSLRLSVMKTNPARRLYERLGFHISDVGEVYLSMVWYKS